MVSAWARLWRLPAGPGVTHGYPRRAPKKAQRGCPWVAPMLEVLIIIVEIKMIINLVTTLQGLN